MKLSLLRNAIYQLVIPILSVMVIAAGLWYCLSLFDPPKDYKLLGVEANTNHQKSANLPLHQWHPIKLPHDWKTLDSAKQKVVWYRANSNSFNNAALYIPNVNSYLTVWLDQEKVFDETYKTSRSNNLWNHPRWIALGKVKAGQALTLKVQTDQPGYGMLGTAYLAESTQLQPFYSGWIRFHITYLEYVTAAMLLTALFMGLIWTQRRDESVFGYAAAFMMVWFFHNLQLFTKDLPLERALVDWYAKLTLCWMVIFIIVFLHRLLGEKPKFFERVLFFYGAVSSILTLILAYKIPDSFWLLTSRFWDSLTLLMGIYPTYRVVRAAIFRNDKTIAFTAMAGTLIVAFGGHDWLMVNTDLSREKGYLIHYSAIVAMIVFGTILLQRFVTAMNAAEQLNITLEERIQIARQQIEQQYSDVQQLQQEQTLAEERERIMRDMHDGIGGHLVSCISIVESQPDNNQAIIDILRTSLLDLRLMIDSLEPSSKDILSMLAMLRERTEQQLKLVNIHYNWKVRDISEEFEFTPDVILQLLRILQEAITNILKHANASEITVSTKEEKIDDINHVVIQISDNGDGFDINQSNTGYGIANMHKRAVRIGATINFTSNNGGTLFKLTLPANRL